jgi:hypothetical protein
MVSFLKNLFTFRNALPVYNAGIIIKMHNSFSWQMMGAFWVQKPMSRELGDCTLQQTQGKMCIS